MKCPNCKNKFVNRNTTFIQCICGWKWEHGKWWSIKEQIKPMASGMIDTQEKTLREKIAKIVKEAIEAQINWDDWLEGNEEEPTDALLSLIREDVRGMKVKVYDKQEIYLSRLNKEDAWYRDGRTRGYNQALSDLLKRLR